MAVLTLGWVGTVPQASAATSSCDGVWVVVDYGSLGGTSTKCAGSHATGKAALTSAGFDPTLDNGMITKISGKPSNPDTNKDYWSYWTATLKSDGSYSGWSYSNLGATSSHPAKGNAEGWRYQPLSAGKVAPGAAPPKGEATPEPTPTPTKTTKPTATAKPTATRKPTASASTSSSTRTPSATATPARSATPTSTPPASISPTVATPTTSPSDDATELGQQQASNSQPPGQGGTPVGALVAAGLVVTGSAGVGGWWLLKGRRR
jgi:hypothetical protein